MDNGSQVKSPVNMIAKFASINRGAFMGGRASREGHENLSEGVFSMDFIALEKMNDLLKNAPNTSAILSILMQKIGIKGLEGTFSFMQDVNFSQGLDLKSLSIFKGLNKSVKTVMSSLGANAR